MKPRKTRLSVLALNTHHTLVAFSLLAAFALGAVYLFVLNHVAFRGYVLQQEMHSRSGLEDRVAVLDMKISKAEAKDYLSTDSFYKGMVVQHRPRFLVLKPNVTAQVNSSVLRK